MSRIPTDQEKLRAAIDYFTELKANYKRICEWVACHELNNACLLDDDIYALLRSYDGDDPNWDSQVFIDEGKRLNDLKGGGD